MRNRQWLVARTPAGAALPEDFQLAEAPPGEPGPGQVLLQIHYLSIDPWTRGQIEQPGRVVPSEAVGEVLRSNSPLFQPGDFALGMMGWQEYAVTDGARLRKLDPAAALAGSDAKVAYLTEQLGFDAGFNYKAVPDYVAALSALCPEGIDVYFDNVGGPILDAVTELLKPTSRVAISGQISRYNLTNRPPSRLSEMAGRLARVEDFWAAKYPARLQQARTDLAEWVRTGLIQYRESVVDGFENAPRAFIGMMRGENTGKQLVRL